MKVLEKLKPLMPYPETKSHPELGKVSLTPNAIESFPKATHTIQSECRIMFDRRLLPGDDPDKAIQQIKDEVGAIVGTAFMRCLHFDAGVAPLRPSAPAPGGVATA